MKKKTKRRKNKQRGGAQKRPMGKGTGKLTILDSFKRKYANTGKSGYGNAFAEISDGQKKSCWSWWIWPVSNNDAFGRSKNRKLWSLSDEECRDFILDQGLGPKWLAIMNEAHRQVIEEGKSLNQIAGYPKGLWQSDLWALLHSCELFNRVASTMKHLGKQIVDDILDVSGAILEIEIKPPPPTDLEPVKGKKVGVPKGVRTRSPARAASAGRGSRESVRGRMLSQKRSVTPLRATAVSHKTTGSAGDSRAARIKAAVADKTTGSMASRPEGRVSSQSGTRSGTPAPARRLVPHASTGKSKDPHKREKAAFRSAGRRVSNHPVDEEGIEEARRKIHARASKNGFKERISVEDVKSMFTKDQFDFLMKRVGGMKALRDPSLSIALSEEYQEHTKKDMDKIIEDELQEQIARATWRENMGRYAKDLDSDPVKGTQYRLDNVAGDGACLFRAILLSNYGGGRYGGDPQNYRDLNFDEQTERALRLRDECIAWNLEHWGERGDAIVGAHGALIDAKLSTMAGGRGLYEGSIYGMEAEQAQNFYRIFMENPNEWADMPEITAAAEVLNIIIIVYPHNQHCEPPGPPPEQDAIISVIGKHMGNDDRNFARPWRPRRCRIYHQGIHYQAFVPITDNAHRYLGDGASS